MAKAFSELSERESLALAVCLEDDARISGDYADRLKLPVAFPSAADGLSPHSGGKSLNGPLIAFFRNALRELTILITSNANKYAEQYDSR